MIYASLRWMASVALHWFYGDIRVVNREKIPRNVPLLIAVNHPNALVDSLLVGWLMPCRVVMTAKATLLKNPFVAVLFKMLGVVPLRRTSDEAGNHDADPVNPSRNSGAFREMLQALKHKGAVLIFPEGKTHSNSELAPLKSGLARVALQARDNLGIESVHILPIGLVFENKGSPGSIVGVRVGDSINMDDWPAASDHAALTAELTTRLQSVSASKLPPQLPTHPTTHGPIQKAVIKLAATWGRLTHRLPVRLARQLAVMMSTGPEDPAMLTIVIGVALSLATYAIHLAVLGALVHSLWIALVYLAALIVGAHWAAFEPHLRR